MLAEIDAASEARHRKTMFEEVSNARADMKAGTLYAASGENSWIYYGQITSEKKVGFFRRRDHAIADPDMILASPIMSIITVAYPSITRALRQGLWKKLGRLSVAKSLQKPQPSVQWPVGTLMVTIWEEGSENRDTTVDDPAIQEMELMAVWDAEHHLPARLTADFGVEPGEWHIGGPIGRERKIKEEMARRFPDTPWHQLPADWVFTTAEKKDTPEGSEGQS